MFFARSLLHILGVLRLVRGILPGLKESGAKRRVKMGLADAGRGLSLGLGCMKQDWGVEGGLGLSHGERHWFLRKLGTNCV